MDVDMIDTASALNPFSPIYQQILMTSQACTWISKATICLATAHCP